MEEEEVSEEMSPPPEPVDSPEDTPLPESDPKQNPAKKPTRQWAAWTRQEEASFFNALRQVGKNFEKITLCVQSKNKDQVRHYYYRLVRRMRKLLGPQFSLDTRNSTNIIAAMLCWWSLLEKFSCSASKLHLKPRRFKSFVDALGKQLLKDLSSTPVLRKTPGNQSFSVPLTTDSPGGSKAASSKGALFKRVVDPNSNKSGVIKGDLSATRTVREKRRAGDVGASAAYKKWERAAMPGVSLVADAAEELERYMMTQYLSNVDATLLASSPNNLSTVDDVVTNLMKEADLQAPSELKLQLFPLNETTQKAAVAPPSPSLPPHSRPSNHSIPSVDIMPALPKPPTADDTKMGAGQTGKLQPRGDSSTPSQDVSPDSQADVLEDQGGFDIPEVTPSGETSPTFPPPPEHGKDRSASPTEDLQQKSPQLHNLSDSGFEDRFLSCRAKRIKVMLEDSLRTLVQEGPKFSTTLLTSTVQEQHSLDLPLDSLTARFHAMCVHMGLQEIQGLLRQKPLNKARVIEAIQESTSAWTTQYKESAPTEVKKLISLLETLVMRLEGKALPRLLGEEIVTMADQQARPLMGQLNIAVSSVTQEIKLLNTEIPGLEEKISKMKTLEHEQEEEAERFECMAEDARNKAKEYRSQQMAAATQLRCLRIASKTFHMQTDQLLQRVEETADFLTLFDEEQKKSKAEEPPEAALILAYSCDSREHDS